MNHQTSEELSQQAPILPPEAGEVVLFCVPFRSDRMLENFSASFRELEDVAPTIIEQRAAGHQSLLLQRVGEGHHCCAVDAEEPSNVLLGGARVPGHDTHHSKLARVNAPFRQCCGGPPRHLGQSVLERVPEDARGFGSYRVRV